VKKITELKWDVKGRLTSIGWKADKIEDKIVIIVTKLNEVIEVLNSIAQNKRKK
jgi:hypothetical protein